jgi:pyruvate kinase
VVITDTRAPVVPLVRHRGRTPILVLTRDAALRHQLSLTWGVDTFVVPAAGTMEEMLLEVEWAMLELGRCEPGDLIVSLTGTGGGGEGGGAEAVRIHRVGEGGQRTGRRSATAAT